MVDENGKAVRTADGHLKASTGSQFTDALSMFGAGDMASTSQLIMGGQRINMDTDMDGNVFMNRDSSEMAAEKAFSANAGKRVATKKFSYDTGKTDKGGKPIIQPVEKGQPFDMSSIPKDQRDIAKEASRVSDTKITKTTKGILNASGEALSRISPFTKSKKTLNPSDNGSDKKDGSQDTSDAVKDPHKNSFNQDTESKTSPSEKSIPKTDKSSNSITGEYKTVGRKLDKEGTGTQRTEERKALTVTGIKSLFIDLAT